LKEQKLPLIPGRAWSRNFRNRNHSEAESKKTGREIRFQLGQKIITPAAEILPKDTNLSSNETLKMLARITF